MTLALETLVDVLKAAGEPTRFRLLKLLSSGDLTVTDLTEILGQSQPRISRHLKLLSDVALIDRYQEGAWAYFRLSADGASVELVRTMLSAARDDDAVLARDAERLAALKQARSERARDYFSRNAQEWDILRRLHVHEAEVEAALVSLVGDCPVDQMLDLGTGTGPSIAMLSASMPVATCWQSPGPISTAPALARRRCARAISSICRWNQGNSIS